MKTTAGHGFNVRQEMFKDIVLGTLIWACVLGFLNDYTDIVYARSYSFLFLAALVLALLVLATLWAKKQVLSRLDRSRGIPHTSLIFLGTWFILFASKFVFIGATDILFDGNVTVDGFFNIAVVVMTVTVIQQAIEYLFARLAD